MKNRLKDKSGTMHYLKTDITKEVELKNAFKWIKENLGGVDVLVNNAGVLILRDASDGNIEEWRKMFELNVFALGACSREAINSMKERKVDDGHIVNINSASSHRIPPFPGVTPYCSSKHASKAVTEGLRRELASQNTKIKVTSISPGMVESEMLETFSKDVDTTNLTILYGKDIADAVHYALATPPHVQVNEIIIRPVGDGI
uniref:Dehydrogenase/reductase SDR family member 11 n=1 Tax=Graphocephala atropunctata TaxID=36148 RepID=A0A1B6MSG0_9HEMI